VLTIDGHIINSRSANLKSSLDFDCLSGLAFLVQNLWPFWTRNTRKATTTKKQQKVSIFNLTVFLKNFCWLWNEPLTKLPLVMKHIAWVISGFQTNIGRCGVKTVWVRWVGRVHRVDTDTKQGY